MDILPICALEWASFCSSGQVVLSMLLKICCSWSWVRQMTLSFGLFAIVVLWVWDLFADCILSTLLAFVFPGPLCTALVPTWTVVASEVFLLRPRLFARVLWVLSREASWGNCLEAVINFGGLVPWVFCWHKGKKARNISARTVPNNARCKCKKQILKHLPW